MNQQEKDRITNNLLELVRETDCSPLFISVLISRKILSLSDEDAINCIPSKYAKNSKFYTIIRTRKDAYKHLLCALNQTGQTGLISLLTTERSLDASTDTSSENLDSRGIKRKFECSVDNCIPNKQTLLGVPRKTILFHVDPPSILFTGRKEELDKIEGTFRPGTTTIICQASIVGLGGIGKSELAKKFISVLATDNNVSIVWLNAETEMELADDFRTLAKDELDIKIFDSSNSLKDIKTIVKETYDYFENSSCLFVFDNAENNDFLIKYLPLSHTFKDCDSKKPSILITSRDNDWDAQHFDSQLSINLDVFKNEEAEEFVKKGLGLLQEDGQLTGSNLLKHIQNLVKRLQCFPLALQQAVSYIQQQKKLVVDYGALNYLEELEKNAENFLKIKLTGYRLTTYKTWKTTMDKILNDERCGKLATKILHVIAYISADGILCSIFENIDDTDVLGLREAILLLNRYSVVKIQSRKSFGDTIISIHRLVQEVIRIDLKSQSEEQLTLATVLNLLTCVNDIDNLNHLQLAWQHSKSYADIAQTFSNIPGRIVDCLMLNVHLNHAYDTAITEKMFLREIMSSEQNDIIGDLEYQICDCLLIQQQFEKCESRISAVVGNENIITENTSLNSIKLMRLRGWIKLAKAEFQEAKKVFENILSFWNKEFTREEEIVRGDVLRGLAGLHYQNEEIEIAVSYFLKAKEIFSRHLGDKDPKVATVNLWIELLRCYLEIFDQSPKHLSQAYMSTISLKGIDQNIILSIGYNIAWYLFFIAGEVDEAIKMCRDVIKRVEARVGKNNIYHLNTYLLHGYVLVEKGLYEEGLDISLNSYLLSKDQFGENSLEALEARSVLAAALLGRGFLENAVLTAQSVSKHIDEIKEISTYDCFYYVTMKLELAKVYEMNKDYKKAYNYVMYAWNSLQTDLSKLKYPILESNVSTGLIRLKNLLTNY